MNQRGAIAELVQFNVDMHAKVHKVDARLTQLEGEVARLRTTASTTDASAARSALVLNSHAIPDVDGRSPPAQNGSKVPIKALAKRPIADAFAGEGVTMPGRTKYRKKLEVKIPGKADGSAPGIGLPTPQTSVSGPSVAQAAQLTSSRPFRQHSRLLWKPRSPLHRVLRTHPDGLALQILTRRLQRQSTSGIFTTSTNRPRQSMWPCPWYRLQIRRSLSTSLILSPSLLSRSACTPVAGVLRRSSSRSMSIASSNRPTCATLAR